MGGTFGWSKSEETVIGEIEDGANYYLEVDEERIDVVVAERDGRKYLRTDPDKTEKNNLLSYSPQGTGRLLDGPTTPGSTASLST